jgi:hypothetical protein
MKRDAEVNYLNKLCRGAEVGGFTKHELSQFHSSPASWASVGVISLSISPTLQGAWHVEASSIKSVW